MIQASKASENFPSISNNSDCHIHHLAVQFYGPEIVFLCSFDFGYVHP